MYDVLHKAVIAACLSALWHSPAQGAGPPSSTEDLVKPGPPPLRLDILSRNLWDAFRDNPQRRPVTGKTRLDWVWLAARYDKDGDGVIISKEFPDLPDLFKRLDRNWDGKLTRADFDWSKDTVLGLQKATTFALHKIVDRSSDGKISLKEWTAAFEKVAGEKGYLTDQDLEELIFKPRVVKGLRERKFFSRTGQDSLMRLQRMFEKGNLFTDGPEPGEMAPDFALRTPDGKASVRLSSFRDKKPVVLIFASFT